MTVPSGRAVTADLRWSTLVRGTPIVSAPSLEDVFLALTGRSMREED